MVLLLISLPGPGPAAEHRPGRHPPPPPGHHQRHSSPCPHCRRDGPQQPQPPSRYWSVVTDQVRRSLQRVTHQCHFTGTGGRVCSGRGRTLVAYDCQSPELRYIMIRCGARDSNVTVLPVCTILCSVHCDVLCCKFQTPLCCVMLCMSAIIFRFGLDI